MADDGRKGAGPTPVTIYGRTYHLRGEGDPGYLGELAGLVDETMRDVAQTTGTADTLKVAIMAALNIADDYMQAREGVDTRKSRDTDARVARMVTLLDEVLAE